MEDMLNALFTVKEMVELLQDHEIQTSEQMIRRYLRQGKIKGNSPSNRKEGWTILGHEVFRYWNSLRYEGTIHEEDIDDATLIKRLLNEVESLEKQVSELSRENYDLRVKMGMEDHLPF